MSYQTLYPNPHQWYPVAFFFSMVFHSELRFMEYPGRPLCVRLHQKFIQLQTWHRTPGLHKLRTPKSLLFCLFPLPGSCLQVTISIYGHQWWGPIEIVDITPTTTDISGASIALSISPEEATRGAGDGMLRRVGTAMKSLNRMAMDESMLHVSQCGA